MNIIFQNLYIVIFVIFQKHRSKISSRYNRIEKLTIVKKIDRIIKLKETNYIRTYIFRRVNNVRSEELLGCRILQTAFGFREQCRGEYASDHVVCGMVNRLQAKCQLRTLFTRLTAQLASCSIEGSTVYEWILVFLFRCNTLRM